jgi:hypothetical protein
VRKDLNSHCAAHAQHIRRQLIGDASLTVIAEEFHKFGTGRTPAKLASLRKKDTGEPS